MNSHHTNTGSWISAILIATGIMLVPAVQGWAQTTGPQNFIYNGHLLDTDGDPLTTSHTIRTSWWNTADYLAGDVTGTGAINESATGYIAWKEEDVFTPDTNGYFSVEIGFPNFQTMTPAQLASLYVQVEVKATGSADTAYELLDINPGSATIDRSSIESVPFAINADMLDQRHVGTASGSIPVLQSGGVLSQSAIPSGLTLNSFAIDSDASSTGSITLTLGSGGTLVYNVSTRQFELNRSTSVQGDMTVTGLINGVDITTLGTDTDRHLKVSSGSGLQVNIAAGDYRLGATQTLHSGTTGQPINDNATNYLYFTTSGLSVTTTSFPENQLHIPLATVTASGGAITSVVDRRAFQADYRQKNAKKVFHPTFENVSYRADGSSNVGQLKVATDASPIKGHYSWTSSQSALNDYDVVLSVELPPSFTEFQNDPFSVEYRTGHADTANNQIDVFVYDTSGSLVSLSGTSTDLVSTTWASTDIGFSGSPSWVGGNDFTVVFRMAATTSGRADLGNVTFQWVEIES